MAQITLLKGYPDNIGRRKAFAGDISGPTSYVTGGDPVTLPNYQHYIDQIQGDFSVTGTYYAKFINSSAGPRATWKVKWIVSATNVEVAATTNLSAETIRVGGFVGQY